MILLYAVAGLAGMVLARAWVEAKQAAAGKPASEPGPEIKAITEPVSTGASMAEAAGQTAAAPQNMMVPAVLPVGSVGLLGMEPISETMTQWLKTPLTWPVGVARITEGGAILW